MALAVVCIAAACSSANGGDDPSPDAAAPDAAASDAEAAGAARSAASASSASQALEPIQARFGAVTTLFDARHQALIDGFDHVGARLLTRIVEVPAQRKGRFATVALAERADGAFTITEEHSQLSVEVRPRDALPVPAAIDGKLVVYAGGHTSGGDLIHRVTLDGTEDYVYLDEGNPTRSLDYDATLGAGVAGLRLVADTFELLDLGGAPRIHMDAPYAVDATGERHAARVSVSGCRYDTDPRAPWDRPLVEPGSRSCAVHIEWDADLPRPLLVDPMWSTAAVAGPRLAMLSTGKVLGRASTASKLYDPASGTVASTGSGVVSRNLPYLYKTASGTALAVRSTGSCSTSTHNCSTVEIYNPGSGTWTLSPVTIGTDLPSSVCATQLASGKILTCGNSPDTADCFLYNPSTDSVASAADVTGGCSGNVMVTLSDGTALSVRGTSAYRYNPSTDSWSGAAAPLSSITAFAGPRTAALLSSGAVLFAMQTGQSQLYRPSTNAWSYTSEGAAPRASSVVSLGNGKALSADGDLYDSATNVWSVTAGFPFGSSTWIPDWVQLSSDEFYGSSSSGAAVYDSGTNLGAPCSLASQCPAGNCVDGVCCESACTNACKACSAARKGQGSDGTCGFVKAGNDPKNDCSAAATTTCGLDGTCDGSGGCRYYAAGTVCGATSCNGSTLTGATCNASHACAPGSVPCDPYLCATSTTCGTSCTSTAQCVSGYYCRTSDSTCQPAQGPGGACTTAAECSTGYCVDGFCCDAPCTGTCQACSAAKTGGSADGVCGAVAAGTDPDSECADDGANSCDKNGTCSGATGCALYPAGTSCGATSCSAGTQSGHSCDGFGTCNPTNVTYCSPYVCNGSTCGASCNGDGDCIAGSWCRTSDHTCQADQANGATCTSTTQCASGNCVDGYCCDSACAAGCQACSAAKKGSGANGTCGNVANGSDPDGECADQGASSCGTDGACSGSGTCRRYALGTTCGSTTCDSGTNQQSGHSCDGFGACNPTNVTSCGLYVCSGATACRTQCSSDADCVTAAWCDTASHTCEADQSLGSACGSASACTSGFCADGVCCDQACGGPCKACTDAKKGTTGSDGVCGNVGAASDPDNDCPDDGAGTCQRNGLCSGTGSCQLYDQGTACGSTTCSSGTQTGYGCDGLGSCSPSSTKPCTPYLCSGNACATSCLDDSGCIAADYCAADRTCKADKSKGQSCTRAGECQSGNCVDGFCCDGPCAGKCQACSAALTGGVDGTCSANLGGTDPDDECSQDSPSSCGQDGQCDGVGACRKYPSGVACGTTSCSAGNQTGYACNGAGLCKAAQTTPCAPYICNGGSCGTTCAADTDCVATSYCDSTSHCSPDQDKGAVCSSASQCKSGNCVDGVCCDQACTGGCQACSDAAKGTTGADGVCGPVAAGTDPGNDCAADTPATCQLTGACDGSGGCQKYPFGTVCGAALCSGSTLTGQQCNGSGKCVAGQTSFCDPYRCIGDACPTGCAVDADCTTGNFCSASACVPKLGAGEACGAANECSSGFCVEGVCCDTACNGTCQACTAATKLSGVDDGVCDTAAAGQDPHDDCPDDGAASCGRDGMCDDAGACRLYASGVMCLGGACAGNVPTAHACNGTGTCVAAPAIDCKPNLCVSGACQTSCVTDDDCANDAWCDGGNCELKGKNGDPCASKEACVSNLCVDGVCCNAACAGQCEACAEPGSEGTCTPVAGAPRGDRAECAAGTAESPCEAASCDGTTRDQCLGLVGPSVTCRAASCTGGLATVVAKCDGQGACPAEQTVKCEPYVCAGDACGKAPCATDADCSAKFRCAAPPGKKEKDCIPRDVATCDGEHTVTAADGVTTTDCSPYRCEASGICKTECGTIDDCAAPNVCDSNGQCIAPESGAAVDDEGCGCRVAGEQRERGGQDALLLASLAGLALIRRRRAGVRA
ncbi:MAG: hypothetical protein OZ921_14425 [Sorangiineae bacterium]|nr:hypothetical protein [Polyangiaceae bacterium]MEB2323704.1 hypothetical protein [Sorangiineae bacterium]